ncbi:MAG: DUF1549 and DUF1553 domain-containing protein [Verrucomicrobiales bacterium]
MHLPAQKWPLELAAFCMSIAISGIPAATPDPSTHWAFKKLTSPVVPATTIKTWAQNSIDHFILEKIEDAGLTPSQTTDRRSLIRRLYFGLVGLPPNFAEIRSFENDTKPDAYAALVDHLLDSPHFGERWGRHWLDIARYSDTKGYVFEESRDYPYAYTFRDWVIRAFNDDLPYDRFITYQIAADTVASEATGNKNLAAMGFLTVGRRFLNREPDIIDDRIDVTFRGTMALTVACARCHDHKYDPIPTSDYYSLYGVFASSEEPAELPLLEIKKDDAEYREFVKAIGIKQDQIDAYLKKRSVELQQPEFLKRYLITAHEGRDLNPPQLKKLASSRKLIQEITIRWRDHLKSRSSSHDPVYTPWLTFARLNQSDYPKQAAATWQKLKSSGKPINDKLSASLEANLPLSLDELAGRYANILGSDDKDPGLIAAINHTRVDANSIYNLLETAGQQHVRKLRRNRDDLKSKHPGAPPRAMAMFDRNKPVEPRIFERGDPRRQGLPVPRQFLGFLKGADREPFSEGSGRLEMAREIVSKDNPLTARVWVNRIWGHLLGRHLVSTPSDFGLRSNLPSHPELLDHLASNLIAEKWSTKKLIRSIVLSATYQQASGHHPKDPENLLFTHANRRRLDFESLRDSMLTVSGQLDRTQFGRPVSIHTMNYSRRRTVYGHIERQNLPPVFRTFDFANPDVHVPKRSETTVPQQALYMLNGKFAQDQALNLINHPEILALGSEQERIQHLYRRVFARDPDARELTDAIAFLNPGQELSGGPWKYGYGQRDPSSQQVKFKPLPHLTKTSWQGGPILPDPALGWVSLTRNGGHPGTGKTHAILRWITPVDGRYEISTDIRLPSSASDGITVSFASRQGRNLRSWQIAPGKSIHAKVQSLELKGGEALYFIVAPGNTNTHDSFIWNPRVHDIASGKIWLASTGFAQARNSSPSSLWAQYAQALLATNEFAFLD